MRKKQLNPPVEWVDPEVAREHVRSRNNIDPAAPVMLIDHSNLYAMSLVPKSRSIRTPEVRLAGETVCLWLNSERPNHAQVPGTGEYDDWKGTPASRQRIQTLFDQLVEERDSWLKYHDQTPYDPTLGKTVQDDVPDTPFFPLFLCRRQGNRILHFMARYATYPVAILDRRSGRFGLKQQPVHESTPLGEVLAAHSLLTLLQTNTLDLIGRCPRPGCGRWFFKGRDDAKGCNNTDSQWLRDNKPEMLAKRRANDAYNREKDRQQEAQKNRSPSLQ